jgi:predicted DNA-binding transcriptional regulator AlpA
MAPKKPVVATTTAAVAGDRLIRIDEVLRQTGLSRTQLYKRMQADFPKVVKIGERAAAWSENAVQAWISAKLQAALLQRRA